MDDKIVYYMVFQKRPNEIHIFKTLDNRHLIVLTEDQCLDLADNIRDSYRIGISDVFGTLSPMLEYEGGEYYPGIQLIRLGPSATDIHTLVNEIEYYINNLTEKAEIILCNEYEQVPECITDAITMDNCEQLMIDIKAARKIQEWWRRKLYDPNTRVGESYIKSCLRSIPL